jgi:hypothetical protein
MVQMRLWHLRSLQEPVHSKESGFNRCDAGVWGKVGKEREKNY